MVNPVPRAANDTTLLEDVSLECLANFQKALEQLEAIQQQLAATRMVNQMQSELIEKLEQRERLRLQEIENLKLALAAEKAARSLEQQRISAAEQRLKELTQEYERLKKKSRLKSLGTFAVGLAVGVVVAGGSDP